MKSYLQFAICRLRFFGGIIVLLGLMAFRAAANSTYEIPNYAVVTDPVPTPDATNFINDGTFIIDNQSSPYKTHNTFNYTNNGLMQSSYGFRFDTYSTGNSMDSEASSFDNENTIDCGEQIYVWATNILNPGWVNVSDRNSGLMWFAGDNVDLSHTALAMEGLGVNISGNGVFGPNTNFWDPSGSLSATTAESSFIPTPFNFYLYLTNSTPYFKFDSVATNYNVVRAVFIQDTSGSNVTYNVYFDAAADSFGDGNVTVQWAGAYLDPATGQYRTNYLYLNDNYALGASTNVALNNFNSGYPDNFTLTETTAPLFLGTPWPVYQPYFNVFPSGSITNRYAFMDAQLVTVPTNSLVHTNVSALGGRIQITANKELNLDQAQISGANYISLTASNQFDGNGGVPITVPYSDINIGVTNGNLTVSNLLTANIPLWNGTVQAWTTRWLDTSSNITITIDTNGVATTNSFTTTNDYRVLIVGSHISPVSGAQVQNLTLHGTNSVIISDTFNIFGSLFIDAQNLTLTTNGAGNGATSLDGELNVSGDNIFWPSSLPNVHWLTNNGAIRLGNLAQFGAAAPTYVTNIVPTIPAVAATGTLSEIGTNAVNGDKVAIGTWQYIFTNKLSTTISNEVQITNSFGGSMSNLIAAINGAAGSRTKYSSETKVNPFVVASSLTNGAFTVMAKTAGAAGNLIITTNKSVHLSWSDSTLTNGADAIPGTTNVVALYGPYGAFINNGLVSDQGSQIYADYFENSGVFTNGVGGFMLQSTNALMTNGAVYAGRDISLTADTLVMSNVVMQAGQSLTLQVTNLLTDTGVTNGNIWSIGGGSLFGVNLPIRPALGDLLGTTITNTTPPPNKPVMWIWAGTNFGVSTAGYNNNVALGRLILNVPTNGSSFYFNGVGTNNAIYIDYLEFDGQATNGVYNNYNFTNWLSINTNMVIYFAQAYVDGVSVADQINQASRFYGGNDGRLLWVPQYAGYFSSMDVIYPNGTTNTVNAALAESLDIDSDGDGTDNAFDQTPIFVPSEINFTYAVTNSMIKLMWDSIPAATNTVLYRTNWGGMVFTLTNFVSPSAVPPTAGWPITNTVYDALTNEPPRYYRVRVTPSTEDFEYPF